MSATDYLRETARALEECAAALATPLERAVGLCRNCLESGGTIFVCGNGGSAADAQHLAAELVGRVRRERGPLPSIALTTDSSALTAIGNDYGFDQVFSRQLEGLAKPGDLLVALSTSGTSANVVRAARSARRLGCQVVALTGDGGGELGALADALVAVPTRLVTRVQEIHTVCIHVLAEGAEEPFCRADPAAEGGPAVAAPATSR